MCAQLEFLLAGLASSPRRVSYAEARARGVRGASFSILAGVTARCEQECDHAA
jgi:hypothetical protein